MCWDDIYTITDGILAGDIDDASETETEAEEPVDIDDIVDAGEDYFYTED